MRKETFKSWFLSILIILSVVLTMNIWFEKELWSYDYNSFLHSFEKFFIHEKTTLITPDEMITRGRFTPKYITLTNNSKKIVSYLGSEKYIEVKALADEIKSKLVKDGNLYEVSEEDMMAAYKTNSILFRFPLPVDLKSFLHKYDDFFEYLKEPVSSSIIINTTERKYLYFSDVVTKKNYRIPITYDHKKYQEVFAKFTERDGKANLFAFEINVNKQTAIDKFALFDVFGGNISKLDVTPVMYTSQQNRIYDSIFKVFNITKNSARTYVDRENVTNFIENNATFKIYSDGSFVYETGKNSAGLPVGEDVNSAVRFVNSVYTGCFPDAVALLRLDRLENEKNTQVFMFNYITPNGALYFKDSPAVTMTVRDGNIISYTQRLVTIADTDHYQKVSDVIKSFDLMYNSEIAASKKDLKVTDIFPANIYPDEIGWVAEFSDNSIATLE